MAVSLTVDWAFNKPVVYEENMMVIFYIKLVRKLDIMKPS